MNEQQFLQAKERVNKAQQTDSELKGQKTALLKQLKDEFECTTLEAAEKELVSIDEEIEQLTDDIHNGMQELEEKYGL